MPNERAPGPRKNTDGKKRTQAHFNGPRSEDHHGLSQESPIQKYGWTNLGGNLKQEILRS